MFKEHSLSNAIRNPLQNICIQIYVGRDLDLSGLRDVMGHVTNRFVICHFLFVFQWNRTSIFNRLRDTRPQNPCVQVTIFCPMQCTALGRHY